MTGARKLSSISVADYLSGEEVSAVKHEYVGGAVYAMVGARNSHNLIASNALGSLWSSLREHRCQPFNSDTKIRIRLRNETRFYYPDASVMCKFNSPTEAFQDEPVVVIEVLSHKTRRIDQGEKKDAYLTIPSLCVYLLVEQEEASVVAFRKTEAGFVIEEYKGKDSVVPLPEIQAQLPLSDLYQSVEFSREEDE